MSPFSSAFCLSRAGPIVNDFNDDVVRLVVGFQRDFAGARFACLFPDIRRLNAMIGRITHEMDERIGNLFNHSLIQFRVFSFKQKFNLLTLGAANITHQSGEALENCPNRHHANGHDRRLQILGDA